jgi:hypothetical protein
MMAKTTRGAPEARQVRLLENLLIAQLAMAGVPQEEIRKIVGCDMNRVSAIAKHVRIRGSNRRRGRARDGKKAKDTP